MLYDTCKGPPRPGSVREVVFLMIRTKRDFMRLLETFTLAQCLRDDESGKASAEAFDRYKIAVVPYLKQELEGAGQSIAKALDQEFSRGPLSIKPVVSTNKVRSRLNKVVKSLREPPFSWKRRSG